MIIINKSQSVTVENLHTLSVVSVQLGTTPLVSSNYGIGVHYYHGHRHPARKKRHVHRANLDHTYFHLVFFHLFTYARMFQCMFVHDMHCMYHSCMYHMHVTTGWQRGSSDFSGLPKQIFICAKTLKLFENNYNVFVIKQ